MNANSLRSKEIFDYVKKTKSYDNAASHFGLSKETIKRYCRLNKSVLRSEESSVSEKLIPNKKTVLDVIGEKYSEKELTAIANGLGFSNDKPETPKINFNGDKYKFLFFTDPHIGSKYFNEAYFNSAINEAKKEKVSSIIVTGDISEGLSHRPGHCYELSHIGYESQKEYAIELFKKCGSLPVYMITGNHDRWYIKSNGANIVRDICESMENGHYLGHDVGEIIINGCKIMLWHGEDGNSYATSYRIQKIVESISGGEKPNVLLCGHTHKQINMFERNIHCFSGGCLQRQTQWERGKRIQVHIGFWIIELTINDGNVIKINPVWYPIYK